MIGGIQLSTPGLTSSQQAQLHDQNTDTGTTSSSFQLKTGGSGPKIVEKSYGFEVQKADGTVLFYLDINGKIQIGGATGPKIVNKSGACEIQDSAGAKKVAIDSDGRICVHNDSGDRCAWFDDEGNLELLDTSQLDSESLNETDFVTHAKWDVTGDFDDTGGNATYTHSTGVGTLKQIAANLLVAGVGDAWYIVTYTISAATGTVTAEITTDFATSAVALELTDGVAKTVLLQAKTVPTDFTVNATSSAGGAFVMDDVSMKRVVGGDLVAHGDVRLQNTIYFEEGRLICDAAGHLSSRNKDGAGYKNLSGHDLVAQQFCLSDDYTTLGTFCNLLLRLRNNDYRIIFGDIWKTEMASFGIDTARQLASLYGCGITRKINVSAETTLTGASVTIANVAPQHAKVIASGFIVSELITSGDGAVSFSVAYNAGAANQAIAAAQAFAKNTKGQVFFDTNTNDDIATAQVDHVITPNANTFSGGKVYTFCIYESLVAFNDFA